MNEDQPREDDGTARLPLGASLDDTVVARADAPPEAADRCTAGVSPADVAAWWLDGDAVAGVDMDAHVPGCAACREVIDQLAALPSASSALRDDERPAPGRVTERSMGRVRAEALALSILRAFGGGVGRVLRAAPDYLRGRDEGRGPDTQEFPSPDRG